jgi:hypothetical protein
MELADAAAAIRRVVELLDPAATIDARTVDDNFGSTLRLDADVVLDAAAVKRSLSLAEGAATELHPTVTLPLLALSPVELAARWSVALLLPWLGPFMLLLGPASPGIILAMLCHAVALLVLVAAAEAGHAAVSLICATCCAAEFLFLIRELQIRALDPMNLGLATRVAAEVISASSLPPPATPRSAAAVTASAVRNQAASRRAGDGPVAVSTLLQRLSMDMRVPPIQASVLGVF